MKIQQKISGGVILTVTGMVVALYLALGPFISAGFARVERADTEKNVSPRGGRRGRLLKRHAKFTEHVEHVG
jgi:hypothetical protein